MDLDNSDVAQTVDAMSILQYYYDNFSILRLVGFFGSLILTFILTWLIPMLLQKIFREGWGLEINYESDIYKKMIINKYLSKIKSNKRCDNIYVEDEYKNNNGIIIFLRSNLFTLFYLLLRLGILGTGLFLTFLIVSQDLISLIASFSITGIVTILQIGVYLQHLFAHACIIITGKHNNGEHISFPLTGVSGVIVQMGMIYTTLLNINPEWNEINNDSNSSNNNNNNPPNNNNVMNDYHAHMNMSHHSPKSYSSAASIFPIISNNPRDVIISSLPSTYRDLNSDAPFNGRFFTRDKKISNHIGYCGEFIYIHVPNYDLLFSHVIINKE